MSMPARYILDRELTDLRSKILQMAGMVDEAIDHALLALKERDVDLAESVITGDSAINELRYQVEEESLRVLATQQPAARDLRTVVAAIHVAIELERMGDHAAGIAKLVERLDAYEVIDSLHQLPKMARRARKMARKSVEALLELDAAKAQEVIEDDDKLDNQYKKLFGHAVREMHDESYIRRATYLLWVGHNLERIGDRATNIAERAIFSSTGRLGDLAKGAQAQ